MADVMTDKGASPSGSFFQRFLLPGFAFKAVVIGGGYATGREIVEYFMLSGPQAGLMGMILAMAVWSVVCMVTFAFAQKFATFNYSDFFHKMLGPFWISFEIVYVVFVILVLAVFGAVAGEMVVALFDWPSWVGSAILAGTVALIVTFGESGVEGLFRYGSIMIYCVYALFLILVIASFGGHITDSFVNAPATGAPATGEGWALSGLTFASYNVVGAVVVLPLLRNLGSRRDALISGALAGPLAMIPAIAFFACMLAFYPEITDAKLPSDVMLQALEIPAFRILFQFMIFIALVETGTGALHAVNERIAGIWEKRTQGPMSAKWRLIIAIVTLVGCMYVAEGVGLVDLIKHGYSILGYAILLVFVVPLMTIGLVKTFKSSAVTQVSARF